MYGCMAPEDPY